MSPTTLHSATIGAHLRRIALAIAPLVAAVYVAGLATGDFVHWLNDRLAGRGRQRWAAPARRRPVALLQPAAVFAQPTAPLRNPQQVGRVRRAPSGIAVIDRVSFRDLNVAQLRKEAAKVGLPRTLYTKGRRAELIRALCAS